MGTGGGTVTDIGVTAAIAIIIPWFLFAAPFIFDGYHRHYGYY
jgi:hypothetical protein